MSNVLIPFGLKDDRMVSVDAVATGLACGCNCPACFGRLVAKKGASRIHHFAHVASNAICTYGAETAIHRMAKQLLLDARRIFAPGFSWRESASDDDGVEFSESEMVCEAGNHRFDSMFIEADFRWIRPDAIGWLDDRPLLIEIAVRHPVGQDKAERLSRLNVACVEVDLSKVDSSTITEEELRRLVLDESKTKRWISHPRLRDARERVRSRLSERLERANAAIRDRRRSLRQRPRLPSVVPVRAPAPAHRSEQLTHRWLVCAACRAVHNAGPYREAMLLSEFTCAACGASVELSPASRRTIT